MKFEKLKTTAAPGEQGPKPPYNGSSAFRAMAAEVLEVWCEQMRIKRKLEEEELEQELHEKSPSKRASRMLKLSEAVALARRRPGYVVRSVLRIQVGSSTSETPLERLWRFLDYLVRQYDLQALPSECEAAGSVKARSKLDEGAWDVLREEWKAWPTSNKRGKTSEGPE